MIKCSKLSKVAKKFLMSLKLLAKIPTYCNQSGHRPVILRCCSTTWCRTDTL